MFDDWTVVCRWGRQGEDGQSKSFPHSSKWQAEDFIAKKVSEKLNKGGGKASYIEFQDAANGKVAPSAPSVAVPQLKLAEVARSQIAPQDPLVAQLITRLANENKHNILGNTTLTYNDTGQYKGLFSTPQGIVTPHNITRARSYLSDIGDALGGSQSVSTYEMERWVEDYMMLVPVDIGRERLTVSRVFPNLNAVRRQNDVLDSLEASLQLLSQGALQEALGEEAQITAEVPRVFDLTLNLVSASVTAQVEKMFRESLNRGHESSSLQVSRVLEVSIARVKTEWEKKGIPIGNVRRLWHGTRVANVLSILKSGLVIPPSSSSHCTGRMFGDGIYASDQSTKSLNYSYGYWDGGRRDKNCMMFVVDMAMGKEYIPSSYGGSFPKPGYDSTFAKGGKSGVSNNEFVVYRTNQVNILYLVEFSS